jgi:hypothetical protein
MATFSASAKAKAQCKPRSLPSEETDPSDPGCKYTEVKRGLFPILRETCIAKVKEILGERYAHSHGPVVKCINK